MPRSASLASPDPHKTSMRPLDPRRQAATGRTPRPVVTRIPSQRIPGITTVVTRLTSATPCTGVANPIVQGKDWIVTNLVASLRRATREGIGTMMQLPKEIWAPIGDGDLTLLRDGAPLNLGNPRLGTRFADAFPDALVGTISKPIDKVFRSGTRSTITSQIPSTSWT
jgi:hypothetical protein